MLCVCPFCDSSNVTIRSVADGGYAVRCDGCDARGPEKGSESQVRYAWNERVGTE